VLDIFNNEHLLAQLPELKLITERKSLAELKKFILDHDISVGLFNSDYFSTQSIEPFGVQNRGQRQRAFMFKRQIFRMEF